MPDGAARTAGALGAVLAFLALGGSGVTPRTLAVAGVVGLVVYGAAALGGPALRRLLAAPPPPPDASTS